MLYSDNFLNDVINNGNITLLDNLIEPQQLINFTPYDLRILRNMIYAKYNYRFRDDDLRDYFSRFTWYNGTENNVENALTYIDHMNINLIKSLENNYPYLISFQDERVYYNIYNERFYNPYYETWGNLIIMGWSQDGKIFYRSQYLNDIVGGYGYTHYGIFDLKENKIIWNKDYSSIDGYSVNENNFRNNMNEIINFVSNEYNILPVTEYILTNIEGYNIYSRKLFISGRGDYFEIGLNNNINNNTINLFNTPFYAWIRVINRYESLPITENNLMYLCIKSPFEENIVLLILIIEHYIGGDLDGWRSYYYIHGIDLNNLNE
jgi:hypothetical protein